MKTILIFIFTIIVSILSNLYSQNISGEIFYGHKIDELAIDTTKIENSSVKSVIKQQFIKKKKMLSHDIDVYKIKFNDSISLFEPLKTMVSDANPEYKYAVPQRLYYFNRKTNVMQIQRENFGKTYIIEKNNAHTWNITDISADKYGFKCIKATTKIKNTKGIETEVEAWFAKSIPLQLGPLNYNSLPGLIIELRHLGNIYYFRSIKYKNINIPKEPNGIRINQKEYEEMIKKSFGF